MPQLDRQGDVFVLHLGDDENRFAPDWLADVESALDTVEAADGPRALVTAASGKTWSQGLDLAWFQANPEAVPAFIGRVHELLARVLEAGVPTVAAAQGHVFAAGAMLATAHDQLVMREDRGYWCVPEVDIRIPFTPGMSALLQARLSKRTAHEAMTTGRRYGGPDAVAAGIADVAVAEADVLPTALERAGALADKDPKALGTIKARMYAPAVEALRAPQDFSIG